MCDGCEISYNDHVTETKSVTVIHSADKIVYAKRIYYGAIFSISHIVQNISKIDTPLIVHHATRLMLNTIDRTPCHTSYA